MRIFLKISFICACLFLSSISIAEVYKWVDENGKVHFSDTKPSSTRVEEVDIEVNTYTNVSVGDSIYNTGSRVEMYSAEWCTYCKKARNYFKKNNIAFVEYDIDKDINAKRKYNRMKATGVPVILVGDKRMNGFSEEGFQRIYQ